MRVRSAMHPRPGPPDGVWNSSESRLHASLAKDDASSRPYGLVDPSSGGRQFDRKALLAHRSGKVPACTGLKFDAVSATGQEFHMVEQSLTRAIEVQLGWGRWVVVCLQQYT